MKQFSDSVTHQELLKLYEARRSAFESNIVRLQRESNNQSWLRVGLMVGALFILYLAISDYTFLYLISLSLFVAYVFAMVYHDRLKQKLRIMQNLVKINDWEIRALRGDHVAFHGGDEFIDAHHPFVVDLDFFGPGSIYQVVNRTCTEQGGERLAHFLSQPLSSISDISARQDAIRELSSKLEFRQHFQAIGLADSEKKQDQQKVLEWLALPSYLYGKSFYKWLLIVAPVFSMLTLLYWIATGIYGPFALVSLIQWTIVGSHMKHTTLFQDYVGNKRELLEKFMSHFQLLAAEKFSAPVNVRLADRCSEAHTETRSLVDRVKALDLRLNLLATIIFNSTLLYDLQCVYRLEHWREKNRRHLRDWLESIGEADALNSYGTFVFNHPDFIWPTFNQEQRLNARELGHPLIEREVRVSNDVMMEAATNIWLVTGANMAGKSTFLRTVGVNVVLALTGAVVCAKSMDCPVLDVFTGMRNTDSIQDHQSYFYAELLRLQDMISRLRKGSRLLVLLDEILRGTNSTDKLTGSQELVAQMTHYPCLAIIATHDIALGDLEGRYTQVRNYHFETSLQNEELHFDYLLKPGISQGKNATFLMRKMGIIS